MMWYKVLRATASFLIHIFYRIRVHGRVNVPGSGKVLICANHIHNLDPILVAACIKRQIFFMAKSELYQSKILSFLLPKIGVIPVQRDDADAASLKSALKVLKAGGALGIFPEGHRSQKRSEFKAGAAMLAVKTRTPIVPVYIRANYKLFGRLDVSIGESFELDEYYALKPTHDMYAQLANGLIAAKIWELDTIDMAGGAS